MYDMRILRQCQDCRRLGIASVIVQIGTFYSERKITRFSRNVFTICWTWRHHTSLPVLAAVWKVSRSCGMRLRQSVLCFCHFGRSVSLIKWQMNLPEFLKTPGNIPGRSSKLQKYRCLTSQMTANLNLFTF